MIVTMIIIYYDYYCTQCYYHPQWVSAQSHHFRCKVSRWFLGKSSSMMLLHGIPQGPCHHAQVWWCRCSHPWWLVSWHFLGVWPVFELRISSFIMKGRKNTKRFWWQHQRHKFVFFAVKQRSEARAWSFLWGRGIAPSCGCLLFSTVSHKFTYHASSLAGSERPRHRKTWHCGKTRIKALGCCAAAVRGNARQLDQLDLEEMIYIQNHTNRCYSFALFFF